MDNANEILQKISREITTVIDKVDNEEFKNFAEHIMKANTVFIQGKGRSGLVGKMFAMRLMHSGFNTYVVDETTTPSFNENDLLIILSGSGGGASLQKTVEKVHRLKGSALLVTANNDSVNKEFFDDILFIDASTKVNEIETIQPLGNQFDQSMHIILDAVVVYLIKRLDLSAQSLKERHFNLE